MVRAERLLLAIIPILFWTVAKADTITGTARVKDGDSLVVAGQQIRLQGIDAPEFKQTCRNLADGHEWPCGRASATHLRRLIAKRQVTCVVEDIDKYGRSVAHCRAGRTEVNRRQVADGWAYAFRRYSEAFVPDEDAARAAKRGMWDSDVTPPWDWRAAHRKAH